MGPPPDALPLDRVACGASATIVGLVTGGSSTLRLRELGFGVGRTVRVLSNADPMLCLVNSARVGVDRSLARTVLAAPKLDATSP